MKKLYIFFLLLPLWGFSSAWAQNVRLLGENFNESEITFSVDMSAATPTWVFVEYTTPPLHSPASMSRATFTSVSSSGTLAAGNQGFWLENSATVTAKLSDVPYRFSWCAYAISAPPKAKVQPQGGYSLHGTPPFTINDNITVSASTFGSGTCITSFTDFTYNPGGFTPALEVTATASEARICLGDEVTFTAIATGGTTTEMSYTWNIAGATTSTPSNTYSLVPAAVGYATYTVHATNANDCMSTVSSTGTVTVVAGVIETRTVTAILSYPPLSYTPKSIEAIDVENATYEWRRSGTGGSVTLSDSDALAYDIAKDTDAINTPGTYYYRRYPQSCPPAEGTYTLVVVAPPPSPAGTKTWLKDGSKVIWSGNIREPSNELSTYDRGSDYGLYYAYVVGHSYTELCHDPWFTPTEGYFAASNYEPAWRTPGDFGIDGVEVNGDFQNDGVNNWLYVNAPRGDTKQICCYFESYAGCGNWRTYTMGHARANVRCVALYDY
jgi:hypothetical protein